MMPPIWNDKRRMVPRWRSLARTIESSELSAPPRKTTPTVDGKISAELRSRLEKWRSVPDLINAAELVENAIVDGRELEALDAAKYLLRPEAHATEAILKQAKTLLIRFGLGDAKESIPLRPSQAIHYWRKSIRAHPRNALGWVELSLAQTIAGHPRQAERSMKVALQLAPLNRHVLRSASRLFLHLGDPIQAYEIIARSPATKNDPWLIAAEIALSDIADRKIRCYKLGTEILESGQLRPRQITELAGAAATIEMIGGNRKRAKRFFVQSMDDPTGNSLAQAEWASPFLVTELVPLARFSTVAESREAFAFHLFRSGEFEEAIPVCQQWADDDPFSIRPYEFGASTAGYIGQFEVSKELAKIGLNIRPEAPSLLNCLAFASANLGDLQTATRALDEIKRPDVINGYIALANRGLIAFRQGRVTDGLVLYRQAAEGFRHLRNDSLVASALAYLAREVSLAGLPDAIEFVSRARTAVTVAKDVRLHNIVDEAERIVNATKQRGASKGLSTIDLAGEQQIESGHKS